VEKSMIERIVDNPEWEAAAKRYALARIYNHVYGKNRWSGFEEVDLELTYNAIKVLDASQETPGLGAKILEEAPQKRFYGIPQEGLEHGVVVDKDAKGRKGPGVVKTSDIMTGATITPRAVANAINIMYAYLT
jgi:electron transport complex protein RnfG